MEARDDDRSVDWAPNKIRELEKRLDVVVNRLERRLNTQSERLIDLEANTRRRCNRLSKVEEDVTSMSQQANADRETLRSIQADYTTAAGFNDLINRVRRLESTIEEYAGVVRQQNEAEEPNDEFSTPIGRRIEEKRQEVDRVLGRSPESIVRHSHGQHGPHDHTVEEYAAHQRPIDNETVVPSLDERKHGGLFETTVRVTGVQAMKREAYERGTSNGYEMGRRAALDEAESRVVAALDRIDLFGRHRDEILSALRPTAWYPAQEYVSTPKAGGRVKTKPIKDNPQG